MQVGAPPASLPLLVVRVARYRVATPFVHLLSPAAVGVLVFPVHQKPRPRPVPLRAIKVRERLLPPVPHLLRVAVAAPLGARIPGVPPPTMRGLMWPTDVVLAFRSDRRYLSPHLLRVLLLRPPFCVSALAGAVRPLLWVVRSLHRVAGPGAGAPRVSLSCEVWLPRRVLRLLVLTRHQPSLSARSPSPVGVIPPWASVRMVVPVRTLPLLLLRYAVR